MKKDLLAKIFAIIIVVLFVGTAVTVAVTSIVK